MKVLVIGPEGLFSEFSAIPCSDCILEHAESPEDLTGEIETDIIVDFTTDESPENAAFLLERAKASVVFLNTVKTTLTEISFFTGMLPDHVVGFNGLPGFINRDCWEVTSLAESLPDLPEGFPVQLLRVDDRVGMVTPRVICMIINEAFTTVQEGTASRADIDLGMKLGTGYPFGPFEWAGKIGLEHVYELLEALWEDTHDERYKICALLKKEYMQAHIS